VQVLPLPEVFFHFAGEPFDAQGGVTDARTRQFLQGFVDRFVQWAGAKRA
jgi:chromate reductase